VRFHPFRAALCSTNINHHRPSRNQQQAAYRKPSKPQPSSLFTPQSCLLQLHSKSSSQISYPVSDQRPLRTTISSAREIENKANGYVYRVFAEIFLSTRMAPTTRRQSRLIGAGGETAGAVQEGIELQNIDMGGRKGNKRVSRKVRLANRKTRRGLGK
jgi:hypothetical protein